MKYLYKFPTFLSFVFTFLISQTAYGNPNNITWAALQIGSEVITSNQVKDYINNVVLSLEFQSELFLKSERNYSLYQSQKDQLIVNTFNSALQKMAFTRIIQATALKNKNRQFFAITKKQMLEMIQVSINLELVPFQKEDRSLNDSKKEFVNSLKSKGYPFSPSSTDEDIFNSWSNRLKIRLTEEYRQKEALRFLCSLESCDQVDPFNILIKNRQLFESNNYLFLRYTENETLIAKMAFDSLFLKDQRLKYSNLNKSISNIKYFFYLGKIVNDRFEILHINDKNLFGKYADAIGYPKTNDLGRTSGFILNYSKEGTEGSLSIQLENWLFSRRLVSTDNIKRQYIEEETSFRITSRHFLDEKGEKWIIVGVAGTNRSQASGVGAWIQENFHKVDGSSSRVNIPRDGNDLFFQQLLGFGGKYSIIDTDRIDLIISGEGVSASTDGHYSENNLSIYSALELNISGRNSKLPVFQIELFGEEKIKFDGQLETRFGGRLLYSINKNGKEFKIGLYVERWNTALDREYEGGPSWTMGAMLSYSYSKIKKSIEYEFN